MAKLEYADMNHERHLSDLSIRRLQLAQAGAGICGCESRGKGRCEKCIDKQFARTLKKFHQMTAGR